MNLLEIRHLTVHFGSTAVVEDVSLEIQRGQVLAVVGESGRGKSVTALSIARLLPPNARISGEIVLDGVDTLKMSASDLRQVRGGKVSYIFQDPGTSLNPAMRIGAQILEVLRVHRPERATRETAIALLKKVHITDAETRIDAYPHQFSGGMQQRVMIAMAIASEPLLLVADEPTTALDVTIQAEILALLQNLRAELRMSMLFVTHNLSIVRRIADHVAVMYAGQVVENGLCDRVMRHPRHPYTRALLNSTPRLGRKSTELIGIPGSVPRPGAYPAGCRFHPRCPSASAECAVTTPEFETEVRCLHPLEIV